MLVRDGTGGAEVLYLRRNRSLSFHGGSWVFPGGRIDPEDERGDGPEPAARRAASREALEEAGLAVDPGSLRYLCHWTTPETSPKRFATWFFIAAAEGEVAVDGGEIHDHRWLTPAAALAAQRAGEMGLPAPAFVLSTRLAGHTSAADMIAAAARWSPDRLLPKIYPVSGGRVALYHQDAGFAGDDLEASGPRHRTWMIESGWRYERDF